MAKKRVGKFPKAFRQMAVARLKKCDNIVELSQELGVHRRLFYTWRDQLEPVDCDDEPPPGNSRESTLRKEVSRLKRVLAEKTLEVDFFKGALQKVEARRQQSGNAGERHLRPNPRRDVIARQPQYRTHVSAGAGQPGRFLSVAAGARRWRRRWRCGPRFSRSPSPIGAGTGIGGSARSCGGAGCW